MPVQSHSKVGLAGADCSRIDGFIVCVFWVVFDCRVNEEVGETEHAFCAGGGGVLLLRFNAVTIRAKPRKRNHTASCRNTYRSVKFLLL